MSYRPASDSTVLFTIGGWTLVVAGAIQLFGLGAGMIIVGMSGIFMGFCNHQSEK